MTGFLQFTLKIILSTEFIIGNLGNAFIVLVNIMDWVKRRKISSVDLILTALAISRTIFLLALISSLWRPVPYSSLMIIGKMMRVLNIFFTVTNHFSLWLATCLSIFYFLKIANFSNSFFLYLKWRVKKVVVVALLASLLILFINIVIINTKTDAWIDNHKANRSYNTVLNISEQFCHLFLFPNTMFTLIPFFMSLVTFLLLIFSLWKHLKTMQHNTKGSRDANTMAHIKALHTVVVFMLLYIIFFLSLLLQSWNNESVQKNLNILFFRVIGIAFPSAHSWVLLLGNNKLRQALFSVLWCMKYRPKI
uniref:Taste receptor type 2 n=1 Tax=Nannospalax galili TaxID=1026970 RepID=A0A7S5W8H4_NANGA|nr:taste receptor type 2 member 582b [Nannospalax galili]QKE46424.1 taste receptor type 2 member 582b [Nannospalax galili]